MDMEKVGGYLENHAQAIATREWLQARDEAHPGMDYPRNLLAMVTKKAVIAQSTEVDSPERKKATESLAIAIMLYGSLSGVPDKELLDDLNFLEDSINSVTADLRDEFPAFTREDLTPEMLEKLKTIGYELPPERG